VHYSTISTIENEERHVNPKTAKALSGALGTDLKTLFTIEAKGGNANDNQSR
jgi:plasmid maintenance system antidote protein VapI